MAKRKRKISLKKIIAGVWMSILLLGFIGLMMFMFWSWVSALTGEDWRVLGIFTGLGAVLSFSVWCFKVLEED